MFSTILYSQLSFSFARKAPRLRGLHVKRYFQKNADNVYKAKQELETKLSVPKMPEKLFVKIFNESPKTFLPNNKQNEKYQNRVKKVKELAQKYELAKCMEACMYSNRYILFMMEEDELESLCQAIENDYGFTKVFCKLKQEQIASVFNNYYRTINPKLTVMLDEKIEVFHDYLHMTKEQIVPILAKNPLLIPASRQRIKQTVVLLISVSKSLGEQVLNRERIIKLLNEFPEVFILGQHQIRDLVNIYQDWGLDYNEVWQLILGNPLLLNNFPNEIMPIKKRLFKHFKFTKEMGRLMLRQYPLVLLRQIFKGQFSSVSSLQAKMIFIKERMKLPIDATTLELLQYKFTDIRPRGEILVRAKVPFTQENVIKYIRMNDEEFAKQLEIPLERIVEERQRFKETDELDWRRRKVLKGSGVNEKIRGLVNKMRQDVSVSL